MAAQLQAAQSKGPAFTKIICPAYAILAAKVTECNVLLAQGFSEGTEHKEQVDFLRTAGCDKIQGYYYSKPVPLEEYVKMLEAQK